MSTVVERDDNVDVEAPVGDFTLIEPLRLLLEDREISSNALLILNQPIEAIDLVKIWHRTALHVCADGGANRLYEYFADEGERRKYVPDFIVGDLDSLRDEVRSYYDKLGARVILQKTQYATDYRKAVTLIELYFSGASMRDRLARGDISHHSGLTDLWESQSKSNIGSVELYVLGGIGGRFDQTVHSINQLYVLSKEAPYIRQVFITPTDLIFLLYQGKNYIHYGSKSLFSTSKVPICGLLPLGNESVILNSDGLKYDVKNWSSSMQGSVSTSNGLSGTKGVIIDTSSSITFSIEIDKL